MAYQIPYTLVLRNKFNIMIGKRSSFISTFQFLNLNLFYAYTTQCDRYSRLFDLLMWKTATAGWLTSLWWISITPARPADEMGIRSWIHHQEPPLEAVTRIQRQLVYCNGGLATTLTSQESSLCCLGNQLQTPSSFNPLNVLSPIKSNA